MDSKNILTGGLYGVFRDGGGGGEDKKPPGYVHMDQPVRPNYVPGYNDHTMDMAPKIQERLDALSMDKRGMNKFREEALRSGPSAWANLQRNQQGLMARNALNQGAAMSRGRAAEAASRMAMRGGITSGARERLAKQGMRDYLNMSQDVRNSQMQGDLQIGINDEQNRIQQLGALPGMELQAMQPEFQKVQLWGQANQIDTQNAIQEAANQNIFNLGAYKDQMGAWGSNQTANAMADNTK